MKWFKFVAYTIFSKGFRFWLKRTLLYAIASHEINRGLGSSDVLIFEGRYGKLFNAETLNKAKFDFVEFKTHFVEFKIQEN